MIRWAFILLEKSMVKILGVRVDNLSQEACLAKIDLWLKQDRQRYIVTPNPEFIVCAQKDNRFRRILNRADLSVCDGTGIFLASRFLRQPLGQRISGVDLMELICALAEEQGISVFLLGASAGVAQKAAENLKKDYPNLDIKHSSDESEMPKIFRPTILFVALGAPKQEKWINHYLPLMPQVKLAIGVGGAFDYLSGRVKRAPATARRLGLEWLWRLISEPWRVKRIYQATIVFPWLVLRREMSGFIHRKRLG